MYVRTTYRCCLAQIILMAFKYPHMEFEFEDEPLVQNDSNHPVVVALAQTHSSCHVMIMHHTVALHWLCSSLFAGVCPLSIDVVPMMSSMTPMKSYTIFRSARKEKKPLFIPIQSHSLAPALFYCIRTTPIQLLLAAVAEPLYPLHDLSLPQ